VFFLRRTIFIVVGVAHRVKMIIDAFLFDEFLMVTDFYDSAVFGLIVKILG